MPPLDMKLPGKEENALLLALEILLASIAIILLLLISCLFAPLTYDFDLTRAQRSLQFHLGFHNCCCGLSASRTDGDLDWYLRILGKRIVRSQKKATSASSESAAQPSRSRTRPTLSRSLLRQVISAADVWEQGLHLIATIWQKMKPRHVKVIARIGFSEPHYTGWMMALAGMIKINNNAYTIHIEGVWDEPCLEGELGLAGKVIPGMILWYILKFFLHPEIRLYYRKLRAQTVYSGTPAA